MSIDPRVALEALVSAFEEHLAAATGKRDDDDPAVESAFFNVADSFEAYEDALYAATGEFTPLDVYDDEDDEDDGDDENDQDSGS
ncbi:hypothetical protein LG293_14175 [Citricoccus nitrophenolicus]|uniref:Primosomal protein n=1 Tax=Citricoccus muralis TaxID=169134 RepID=A0A3D9LBR0_9MICC|nr:hypothetical protein [Citricoccus muralis]REE03096.1 hypothetical protein C8E99_0897 [Citricoccus muralis]